MKFSRLVVVIVSLGVYCKGELCKDSTLTIETESESKLYCSDLTADVDCLRPNIARHCKELCKVSFCCADSQAKFGVIVPNKNNPKYTTCGSRNTSGSKKLEKFCKMTGVEDTCPVTCGTCNPIDVILQVMTEQEEAMKEEVRINKEQEEAMKEQEEAMKEQEEAMKEQVRINKEQQKMINLVVNTFACGDHLYHLSDKEKGWYEHEAIAVEWGGHLASIHSAEENNCIVDMIRASYPGKSFIIGLKRNKEEKDEFEYIDETDFDFSNWNVGEPNNQGRENVAVIASYFSYKWNDVPYDVILGGVYKKPNPNLPM